jgi:hypothetical protein
MDKAFAQQFATEWIEAWNHHDIPRVLSHYADDFEMNSPLIVLIAEEPSGRLKGKVAVEAYWRKALNQRPDLKFELITVFTGVRSLTIHYRNNRGTLAAEVFHFGPDNCVTKVFAHYNS